MATEVPASVLTGKKKQVFILSGQSNMSGRGGVYRDQNRKQHWDGVVPPECQPRPSILRFSAKLHWETAHEPLHADIDSAKTNGVGPGMSFANAVGDGGLVGLVPCAVGGTAIKEWARGEELFENMVKRARESAKKDGEIRALLWYQGESDALDQHDAEAYQRNMEALIRNVREDLCLPWLPIIQVGWLVGWFVFIFARWVYFSADKNLTWLVALGLVALRTL